MDIPLHGLMGKNAFQVWHCVRQTISRFQSSADETIAPCHVPLRYKQLYNDRQRHTFNDTIVQIATRCWQLMLNPRYKMGIDHDTYLKMWQLQKPKARQFQAILFDECQDASPVMLNIVENQSHVTTVYVGDRHQRIYGWRGAINAMDKINAVEYPLTHSFRFGACIADVANRVLAHKSESKEIVGNPNVNSTLCVAKPPVTLLCRTNGEIFSQAVKAVKKNQSIAVVGGIESLLVVIESAYALFCDDRFNIIALYEIIDLY